MAELKTKENNKSVKAFLDKACGKEGEKDSLILLKIFEKITMKKAKMWGTSIIGFGNIHYVYKSGREGDWMATGFSPRKQGLSLYILSGFEGKGELLKKLGKHKTGRGCLYINKLEDVDLKVLKKIIKDSYKHVPKTNKLC